MRRNMEADVLTRIEVRAPDECWPWLGARAGGYGQIQILGRRYPAHRVSFALAKGAIPEGLVVCHSCDNKVCCNPDHLFLGTPGDNTRDAQKKGLLAHGERSPRSKLTRAAIEDIRRRSASGESFAALGRAFGTTPTNVMFIVRRVTWKEVA